MSATQRQGSEESCYGQFQISRMRHAYTSISGWHSQLPGYDGFVEEVRWGLNHLADDVRRRADHAVLTAVLGGRLPSTAIHVLAELAPDTVAWLFAELTPEAFGFLVGKLQRESDDRLHIPRCRFVSTAGRRVCLDVCRTPTQRFFRNLGIPLTMKPDMHSFECNWHYGASEGASEGATEDAPGDATQSATQGAPDGGADGG